MNRSDGLGSPMPGGGRHAGLARTPHGRQPDRDAQRVFEREMEHGQAKEALSESQRLGPGPACVGWLAPMEPATGGPPASLGQALASVAARLAVGDVREGHREASIVLDDTLLPDTTLSVRECGGWIVAAFACRQQDACERLRACADSMAMELALELERDVEVAVACDGEPHGQVARAQRPWR